MPGNFIDTNVLAYLASADPHKANRAEQIIQGGGAISVQVLNELANVSRRKMRLSWTDARTLLTNLRDLLTVHPLTIDVHDRALAVAERYDFSIYDAMIVASALCAGCNTLLTEDMQHGMKIESLRIINPFRT